MDMNERPSYPHHVSRGDDSDQPSTGEENHEVLAAEDFPPPITERSQREPLARRLLLTPKMSVLPLWGWALLVLLVLAVVIWAASKQSGNEGAARSTSVSPVPARSAGPAKTSTSRSMTTTTRVQTSTSSEPTSAPEDGFGSGTKLVGKDIQPGRYIAAPNADCYWERESGTAGTFEQVLANDNNSGQVIVDILPTDAAFTSSGCERFRVYSPPALPSDSITEGNWVVGEQINAGSYRASPTRNCYWERSGDAEGRSSKHIIASDVTTQEVVVTLTNGEIFTTHGGCGTWTRFGE